MSGPDAAPLLGLLCLPGMGSARLRVVLHARSPVEAWRAVVAGRPPVPPPAGTAPTAAITADLRRRWASAARAIDPIEVHARHVAAGVSILVEGTEGYPGRLGDDPEPPAVLGSLGDPVVLDEHATVAVVGTRRCTRAGHDVAFELGRDLATAGVVVLSGLAAGIDAAAHRGALDAHGAAPVAVVGTGLDVVYPARNRALWREVAARGAVLSEAPLGARPDRWRFPARNRIIAGLADLVVVVESRERGGSMHTVDEADRRGVDVLAVPGPVRAATSAGTNALLHEGRGPARDAADVLTALGFVAPPREAASPSSPADPRAARLLDAFEWEPATPDALALRTGLGLGELCVLLDELVAGGALVVDGGWYQRTSAGSR